VIHFRIGRVDAWRVLGLGFLLFVSLAPIVWMLLQSIVSDEDRVRGVAPWVIQPTLDAYAGVLGNSDFFTWSGNTLVVIAGTVALVLVASYLAGYALAYLPVPGRRWTARLLLASYVVPQTLVFVPLFILIQRAGLDNNPLALILTYPMLAIPFGSWLFLSYFRGLPEHTIEAAMVEGGSRWTIFWQILLPLSRPVVIAAAVFTVGLAASELLFAQVFLPNADHQTLAAGLSVTTVSPDEVGGVVASALLAGLPVLLLCGAFVRQYVQGLTAALLEGA
jgi:ABC-type glycerol-3-phosphate transport system permease component